MRWIKVMVVLVLGGSVLLAGEEKVRMLHFSKVDLGKVPAGCGA